jgi:nitrate/nitrite transporter NarK
MGTMVDTVGPRYSAAITMLLTAPVMFGMALMQTAAGFILLRMLVGLNLGMFVVDQKWMHGMFNRQVLGRATALSAGEVRGKRCKQGGVHYCAAAVLLGAVYSATCCVALERG